MKALLCSQQRTKRLVLETQIRSGVQDDEETTFNVQIQDQLIFLFPSSDLVKRKCNFSLRTGPMVR